jgi:hypothetical protein
MFAMKLYTKISLILLIPLFSGLTSCIKEEQYPIVPAIEYKNFGTYTAVNGKDSLGVLTISYTDGDGNIGLPDWDTIEPYKYNYYLKILQLIDGQMVELVPPDPDITFNSRIPVLTPTGKNKNIKGDISLSLELYYMTSFLQNDTIGFEVYIKDRDLNQSNTVITPRFKIKR